MLSHPTRLTLLCFALVGATGLGAGEPSVDALLPVAPEVRQILDRRCVLCHGEVIDGRPEIREDLDLSSDEKMRETLVDVQALIDMIAHDKMPQEARLSFRLRKQPEMQERLKTLKSEYAASDEKQTLLTWLAAAGQPSEQAPE